MPWLNGQASQKPRRAYVVPGRSTASAALPTSPLDRQAASDAQLSCSPALWNRHAITRTIGPNKNLIHQWAHIPPLILHPR
eukprot:scaffold296646_cov33-Tisochrysis_lutea.AAC.6